MKGLVMRWRGNVKPQKLKLAPRDNDEGEWKCQQAVSAGKDLPISAAGGNWSVGSVVIRVGIIKANAWCPVNNLDIYLESYILFYMSMGYSDTDLSLSPDPFPMALSHLWVELWTALTLRTHLKKADGGNAGPLLA